MGFFAGILLYVFSLVLLTGCSSGYGRDSIAAGATVFESGLYLVGEDIPAGVYFVETTGNYAYVEISNNRAGGVGNIFTDNISTHRFIEVKDGQFLRVRNGRFVPIEYAPNLVYGNVVAEGMYRVGIDIPAGEFLVRATHRTVNAYVKVATSINSTLNYLVLDYTFIGESKITIEDGQYITLSRARLMLS